MINIKHITIAYGKRLNNAHSYPCMMIPEAKSTFSFLFDSVVQYIQILWDF